MDQLGEHTSLAEPPAVLAPLPTVEPYPALSFPELKPSAAMVREWLWHGYLLPGGATVLTSLWKAGKTTLLAVLLSKLKNGGEVGGLAVRPGRALVVSEEAAELWWDRGRQLALDGHVQWICQPFQGKPTPEQWHDLLAQIGRMHDRQPLDLLTIDTLAKLAPMRTENDPAEMLRTLAPLQPLTARGICVLLCHHPPKGRVRPGQAARGTGALPAWADISLEMYHVNRRNPHDCRRRLWALSRYAVTPPEWVIEWTPDGLDYRALGTSAEPDFTRGWPVLQTLLANADGPMTRDSLHRAWPKSAAKPAKKTLWTWLDRVVRDGHVLQDGEGTRRDPYLYSLPGMVEKWQAKFMAEFTRGVEGNNPKQVNSLGQDAPNVATT